MKKSISSRIKITKTGKILRRAMGQGHNRAKKRSVQIKRKKGSRSINIKLSKHNTTRFTNG